MRGKFKLLSLVLLFIFLFTACGHANKQEDESVDNYDSSSDDFDYEEDTSEDFSDSSDLEEPEENTYIPITSQYLSVFEDLSYDVSEDDTVNMQVAGPQMPADYVGIWNSLQYPYVAMDEYNFIDQGMLVEITSDGYISIIDAYGLTEREYACIVNVPLVDNNGSYSFMFDNDSHGNNGTGEISLTDGTLSVSITRSGDESIDRYNFYYGIFAGTEKFIKDGTEGLTGNDLIYSTVKDYFQALSDKDVEKFKTFINGNVHSEAEVIRNMQSDPDNNFNHSLTLNLVEDNLMFDPNRDVTYSYASSLLGDSDIELALMDLTEGFQFDESNWSTSDIITSSEDSAGDIRVASLWLTDEDEEDRLLQALYRVQKDEVPSGYNKSMLVINASDYYLIASSDYGYNEYSAYGHYVVFQKVSTGLYKVCFIANYEKIEN